MMNNEATHVKTQEDYSKFSSIVNEFLQEQMNILWKKICLKRE